MTERKYTEAELQYFALKRALTEEEQKEIAVKQREGCRTMTEKEMAEHQLKMMRLRYGTP